MGSAIKSISRRWSGGVVPYVIHPEITNVNNINQAFTIWENLTNVRFVRRYLQSDYLEFVLDAHAAGDGYSRIGRLGGNQQIHFAASVGLETCLHEIGHALGLFHEQERSDRDEFVKINFDNILPANRHNFNKEAESINSDVFDYQSVMEYDAFAFAINHSVPTIVPVDPGIPVGLLGRGTTPTQEDAKMINFLYPTKPVVRRSSSQLGAGEVNEISSLVVSDLLDRKLITAVITSSGKLKMVLWSVDALGGIRRLSPVDDANTAGDASSIAIEKVGVNFVTAMRNGGGNLYLISWQLEDGQLVRKADSANLAGTAAVVKIIRLTDFLFLTGCRTGSGDLKLILWSVDATGHFKRITDSGSQAGAISDLSLVKVRSNSTEHIVSSTVKAGNGDIKIITWAISKSNNTITRRGDSGEMIGAGTHLQSTMDPFGYLVISCRDGSGDLLLITFTVSPTGREITRVDDTHSMAGAIGANALVVTRYGVVSAVSNGNGNLFLIKWKIDEDGQFSRIGDSANQAGTIGLVNVQAIPNLSEAPLVTPVKDGSGNMFILSWDDDPQHGEVQR